MNLIEEQIAVLSILANRFDHGIIDEQEFNSKVLETVETITKALKPAPKTTYGKKG